MKTAFSVLVQSNDYTLIEKKSRFIALLLPADSPKQVKKLISECKKQYPNANHYCWAYVIGSVDQPTFMASSDDGEPAGSAGKPIVNVLIHKQLGNCLAVVVRYFGGVKLGVGGLVRAYSQSVSQAALTAKTIRVEPKCSGVIEVPYEYEAQCRHILQQYQIDVLSVAYSQGAEVTIRCAINLKVQLAAYLADASHGRASVSWLE